MLLEFETEVCTRCGGSGRYSYNQIDGDTCFKCHGRTRCLTKRGHAAFLWAKAQREIRCDEVQLGDYIGWRGMKFTVCCIYQDAASRGKSLQPDGSWKPHPPMLHFRNKDGQIGYAASPDHKVEKLGKTKAERNAMLMRAFEYQDTLTQAGTPRKQGTPK